MSNVTKLIPRQTLWSVQYDYQTVFKQFLNINFSKFLKNLVSNKYFPLYEKQMARQLSNKYQWSQKCWHLLQLFQYLNTSFEISQLDIFINFIEEETLRKVMGHFRLWIDLERLYLFNFLKLDKMQFQQDRIYMTLYRTMLFFHTLFSQYDYDDFHQDFIRDFFPQMIKKLQKMQQHLSKNTKALSENIKIILNNFRFRQPILLPNEKFQIAKRQTKSRIAQEVQTIFQIEDRLMHSVKYQQKKQDQNKMKLILNMSFIDSLTKQIQLLIDPRKRIIEQHQRQHQNQQKNQAQNSKKQLQHRLRIHDQSKKNQKPNTTLYQRLQATKHDPYDDANFANYGSLVAVDISKKKELTMVEEKEIISKNDDDQINLYYEEDYLNNIEKVQSDYSKVTKYDLAKNNQSNNKKSTLKNSADDQNKIFNLRYTFQDNVTLTADIIGPNTQRDFDNNILFKNQVDQYLQNTKANLLIKFASKQCHTRTFASIKQKLLHLFPEQFKSSFGAEYYSNKQPLYFSIQKLKTLNRNKFDQMRKIINFMAAQKKIQKLIMDKTVPEYYPRNFQNIKTYNHRYQV